MKQTLALLLTIASFLILSCQEDRVEGASHSVLIVHSWDSIVDNQPKFDSIMIADFNKRGYNVDLHHIYLDAVHEDYYLDRQRLAGVIKDSIAKCQPEIVLCNDDPAYAMATTQEMYDSIFTGLDIVFAGVNLVHQDTQNRFDRITGFEDKIDLVANLEICSNFDGRQNVTVELDQNAYQDSLRSRLYQEIADTNRYIINEGRIRTLNADTLKALYGSKRIVYFISCANPMLNALPGETIDDAERLLTSAYHQANRSKHLQVKYDIYSNHLILATQQPQITAIREQFDLPGKPLFIGGYFTSLETQIADQVDYACRIFAGSKPRFLPILHHVPTYNIDYRAMALIGDEAKYSQLSEKYTFYNLPQSIRHPYLRISILLGIILLGLIIMWLITRWLTAWRNKGNTALLGQLMYEEHMHSLLFDDPHNTLWTYSDGLIHVSKQFAEVYHMPSTITIDQLHTMVHPDTMSGFDLLYNFRQVRGRKRFRLKMTASGGDHWIWTEVIFNATDETAARGELYGILLNIDKVKEIEDTLLEARQKAAEVSLKENFLANISHDLRTPLNAITGFSMILSNKDMTFEPGERQEYGNIIRQNTDMILQMIDSVVEKAQNNSEDLQLICKPMSLRELVQEAYMTNKVIAPKHLRFLLSMDEGDPQVDIDRIRTTQVVNNFLSNAFKFTTEGSITIGWCYAPDDMLEVYVADTGIGLDEEGQRTVFERYAKQNETDCGTGLGLNISKTIIEKENGVIGVQSEVGKGSRFFFRLRRYVETLLLILTFACTSALFQSCDIDTGTERISRRVLVLHGYDKEAVRYVEFDNAIAETFRSNDVIADIHNAYLGISSSKESGRDRLLELADSLIRRNWRPDLILVEGDRPFYYLMDNPLSQYLPYADSIPIIFGALHHPDWELLRDHPNAVAFYDPIDYTTNIDLAISFSKSHVCEIELDYFRQDSLIREELRQAIARPPYVDNTDYHLYNSMNDQRTQKAWNDSIVVVTFSAASPRRNTFIAGNDSLGYTNTRSMFKYSRSFPQLSLKRDVYSAAIVNATGRPQFTAVKAGFGDATADYLAGYFASYRTVGEDLADAGSRLFRGAEPSELTGRQHEKHYYMDYNAMQRIGLRYSDYSDRFQIINAPEQLTAPFSFWIHRVLFFSFFVFVVVIWIFLIVWLRERGEESLLADVKRKSDFRNLAIRGADSKVIRSIDDLENVLSHVHPDNADCAEDMRHDLRDDGTYKYEFPADLVGKGIYHWWQFRVARETTADGKVNIHGLLINIDEQKQYEQDLQIALHLAEEAAQKENFLTTISHEIRTPLNAVVGFSDVIASLPEELLTPDDLEELSGHISEQNTRLAGMIEDILMFSRIESGRLKYVYDEFRVSELLDELAHEWEGRTSPDVRFILANVRDNVYINSDRTRIKYILNHFLSNALKFTERGSIVLTAIYRFNVDEIEFMVADTGKGIPLQKQRAVFDLFWKDDEFIPGLGLGLNISRRLADGLNSRIELESKEGFGTRICLYVKGEIR